MHNKATGLQFFKAPNPLFWGLVRERHSCRRPAANLSLNPAAPPTGQHPKPTKSVCRSLHVGRTAPAPDQRPTVPLQWSAPPARCGHPGRPCPHGSAKEVPATAHLGTLCGHPPLWRGRCKSPVHASFYPLSVVVFLSGRPSAFPVNSRIGYQHLHDHTHLNNWGVKQVQYKL